MELNLLETLDLSDNQLSGALPTDFDFFVGSLSELDLSGNSDLDVSREVAESCARIQRCDIDD